MDNPALRDRGDNGRSWDAFPHLVIFLAIILGSARPLLVSGVGATTEPIFSCDFGTTTMTMWCGMVQSTEDSYDWKLTSSSGNTDSGPFSDHTGNLGGSGRFLWADSNLAIGNVAATISTPEFNFNNSDGRLVFAYHIYSDEEDAEYFEVSACKGGGSVARISRTDTREWLVQELIFSCGTNLTQVSFTSHINDIDIGLDDIDIYIILDTNEDDTTTPSITSTVSSAVLANGSAPLIMLKSSPDPSTTMLATVPSTTDSPMNSQVGTKSSPVSSPSPLKGSDMALTISLSVVAVFVLAAVVVLIYFIYKRRYVPEKPVPKDMGSSYHNKVYNSGDDSVGNDIDNGTSTLDDSTWRSLASVKNSTGMNETRGESMRPNNAPSSASNTMVGDRERGDTEESSYYFKLNPGRASMLADAYEELRIGRKNNASLGRAKDSNTFYAVSEAIGGTSSDAIGAEVNGYEPVVVKDDETGGYQVIDESIDSLRTDADVASSDFRKDYEQVSVPNQRPVPADRPVPAARKNIPPKPQPRIVENVLYKPMNNEVSVKNVLYNPLEEGK